MIHAAPSRSSTVLLALLGLATTSVPAPAAQATPPVVQAQAPARPPTPPAVPATPEARARAPRGTHRPYALAIKREDGFINVALKATRIRVADIAADLARQLRVRIDVGTDLKQEFVTVDVPSSPLESVLQAIAPRVLVDYELRQDARPRPLAIYLLAPTDVAPKANVVERGVSQGMVISGHTEETPTDDGSDPVTIAGDTHQLSITAKNQPLALVAMAVADTLGVPLEMTYPAGELVVVSVTNLPAEDAAIGISPNVRLQVRVDVSQAERTPLKLIVTQPRAQAAR
jgi:hypothetical protein